MTAATAALGGKRILVIEDEWLIAKGLVRDLRQAGAEVLGPVPAIDEALELVGAEQLDGAVLDMNLRGEMAFAVADLLSERGVPFVLSTGYNPDALPRRYSDVPRCGKPIEVGTLARALFPN